MATQIKLKRSTTPLATPTTANLADGEVALNIADKKLYVNNSGSITEVANTVPNPATVTTNMLSSGITNGVGSSLYVSANGSDVLSLSNGNANGKSKQTPFRTVAYALSQATSGDTVYVEAGTYQEIFPLTVPDGVTLRGANLRSTQIYPTTGTNDLNAFVLQGDSHVSDLTVKDFFYNSGNDTGYGFVCATSNNSERSPYIERVTVLTKGSVTSGTDPYGYGQGDAGRGAKLDGAVFATNTIESAVLFNEVTFIVPNSVGLLLTNGVRVEWLNSFVYFAAEGIKGVQGATGRSGAGQTRLKLSGVSGTFAASEVIYQLEDGFKSGTYSRSGATVTVTRAAHGLSNGDVVYADYTSGNGTDGYYTVANVATNTFELTDTSSGTTSGNITYKKADAYGTVASNDGTYVFINGKGTGEFTTGVPTGKNGVIAGDAQVDTAQFKFGTASLLTDGVDDHVVFPTDSDFGFGTTNFAIECFIRPAAVSGVQTFIDFRNASATDTAPVLYLDGTTLHYKVGNTSQISGGTLSTNTWYHVAVARFGGTTRLFLDGTQLGTYTDNNDYGVTKPMVLGGDYVGSDEFGGHIDEVRVSKNSARYTGSFTAPTSPFATDLFTVLLLHFDGTDGATVIADSGKGVKDIRSDGGDSATSLLTADYAQFGAEMRSISSANIYGNKGAIADGAGVKLLLTAHNFAYIGANADFTNDPDLAVPANEVTETNGGRIFYSATNEKGDFRVGDAFIVDQETGNVSFQATSTSQQAANITLSDATGTTTIFPAFIETGNLRLSGNTISSTSGDIIIDPSSQQDIILRSELRAEENLYFDASKKSSFNGDAEGSIAFEVDRKRRHGFTAAGLYTNRELLTFKTEIATVSITNEGSGYDAGTYSFTDVGSDPYTLATASATLTTYGSVKLDGGLTLTSRGSLYSIAPTLTFSAPQDTGGTLPSATVSLNTSSIKLSRIDINDGGAGYGSTPTLDFGTAPVFSFDGGLPVAGLFAQQSHPFIDGDAVVYGNGGNTTLTGLTDGNTYYVVESNDAGFKLSATSGGSAISVGTGTQGEFHTLTGAVPVATVTLTSGAISAISIASRGIGYSSTPSVTINGGSPTTPASLTVVGGSPISTVTLNSQGTGYSSAPSVTVTPDGTDTTGSGGAVNAVIGFGINSVTLNTVGKGYAVIPTIAFIGGSPDTNQDAEATAVINKLTGEVSSVTLNLPGGGYTSVPTVSILGGNGFGADLNVEVLPLQGTITNGGTGYAPGVYQSNFRTITGSGTGASASFTILGLSGNITNAGSGYTPADYSNVQLFNNNPSATYAVTVIQRDLVQLTGVSGTIAVGNTITDPSGGSGTVTFVFTDGNDTYVYLNTGSSQFTVGDTATASGGGSGTVFAWSQNQDRYAINGQETPSINLNTSNTYRFDQSDASNTGHPWTLGTYTFGEYVVQNWGTAGTAGAFTEVVVKSAATGPITYVCTTHGVGMGRGGELTVSSGSVGEFGSGALADVTVAANGTITSFAITTQGDDYKVGDTLSTDNTYLGAGSGSGFAFSITTNDTSISSVTLISPSGSGYAVNDTVGVEDATIDSVGNGGGFVFTITKAGFINTVTPSTAGFNFSVGDVLSLDTSPMGSGSNLAIAVGSVNETEVFQYSPNGSLTSTNFNIAETGAVSFSNGASISSAGLLQSPDIQSTATLQVGTNLTVGGTSVLTGDLTANGSVNTITNGQLQIQDGSATTPSFTLQNSLTTGLYAAGADDIGLTISGTQRGSISATGFDLSTDFVVDQNLTETTPFFKIDAVNEQIDIGAATTQLRIGNDNSITAIGTDSNVDISVAPKGQGNLILKGTGDVNNLIQVTDGTSETLNIVPNTGDLSSEGFVEASKNLKLVDNTISNSSLASTLSFGQVKTVSATGTATGYTDGSYTRVAVSSTTGNGTDAEFDVTIAGGDITAITPSTGYLGFNYKSGDTLILDTANIGSGSGKTLTITAVQGAGIDITPQNGKDVRIDTNSALVIPSGTTNQRPLTANRLTGMVRFNTTQLQFEGYNGSDFVSLGGVRDVDQDTYILTESSPGQDEDTFEFYAAGINNLSLNNTLMTFRSNMTGVRMDAASFKFDYPSVTVFDSASTTGNTFEFLSRGSAIVSIRTKRDLEISGGLRLRAVPPQGVIATIDAATITATNGAYTPNGSFTNLASSAQIDGTGATFDVTIDGSGNVSTIAVNSGGTLYAANEVITIAGTLLGGLTPANDVTFEVDTISGATAAFTKQEVLNQDLVTFMDDKPFVSYDANGSEAGFKVNRGWQAGTESYLTVIDSTADFVELDDCRVEGGQLSSFTTSTSFAQFTRSDFKGAKSLITIESDDGKVHMVEVTSICAAAGTNAYATVTNSVTSDNDLIDVSISVIGGIVTIALAKSSAATSSTSFTGRFTTTKVKV